MDEEYTTEYKFKLTPASKIAEYLSSPNDHVINPSFYKGSKNVLQLIENNVIALFRTFNTRVLKLKFRDNNVIVSGDSSARSCSCSNNLFNLDYFDHELSKAKYITIRTKHDTLYVRLPTLKQTALSQSDFEKAMKMIPNGDINEFRNIVTQNTLFEMWDDEDKSPGDDQYGVFIRSIKMCYSWYTSLYVLEQLVLS